MRRSFGCAFAFLLSSSLAGCSCDLCPPKVLFLAKPAEGSRVVWTVDDKPSTTTEKIDHWMDRSAPPSCEAYFDGTARVEGDEAGEAEPKPYLLCKRDSLEPRIGIDQFELTYPYNLIPGYRGEASVHINPISWTEGQVLALRGGDFGLELFYARDVATGGGAICKLPVDDLPITVTVERAVGGAAGEPEGVTPDFERVFLVEFALDAARGEVDRSNPKIEGACPNTLTLSASVRLRIDAASVTPDPCILDGADAGVEAEAPDAGLL